MSRWKTPLQILFAVACTVAAWSFLAGARLTADESRIARLEERQDILERAIIPRLDKIDSNIMELRVMYERDHAQQELLHPGLRRK